jgi:tRNA A37 threonylcarbamoyladenosine synthetase subunit TsaC/SUA5/YrdC
MTEFDIQKDAGRAVDAVEAGGIAIVALDVAYAIIGNSEAAMRRIFTAKQRSFDKPSGMLSNWRLFNDIQICGERERAVVNSIVNEHGLPMSTVAPFRADHPLFTDVAPFVIGHSSKAGTLDMLLNAGHLHDELVGQALARGLPLFGSSANTSLRGSKYRLEDIEAPVRAAADIAFDHGLGKYANDAGRSSTIIDLRDFKTIRVGVCYERICEILLEEFAIDLAAIGLAGERAAMG